LVYVIIVVSFRIVMMSWFHSRENYVRFLQWSYESENKLSSHHLSFITIHVRIQTSYIPRREYGSDWVTDLKKGLNSLYLYRPLVEPRMVGDAQGFFPSMGNPFCRGIVPIW
jgi:hypothetical protein